MAGATSIPVSFAASVNILHIIAYLLIKACTLHGLERYLSSHRVTEHVDSTRTHAANVAHRFHMNTLYCARLLFVDPLVYCLHVCTTMARMSYSMKDAYTM